MIIIMMIIIILIIIKILITQNIVLPGAYEIGQVFHCRAGQSFIGIGHVCV